MENLLLFWLEEYERGFIELTRNDDEPDYFEIVGIFTPFEAVQVHTWISPDYQKILSHAKTLYDYVLKSFEKRDGRDRFFLPESSKHISFTINRPECRVPWYEYVQDFPESLLLVFDPPQEAREAGWLDSELLPEYKDKFDTELTALEDYFCID